MSEVTTIKSCSNAGDLISFMPAMKEHYRATEKKIILYCWLNRPMQYPDGNWHPVQYNGEKVAMNKSMFDFLRPLFLAQDFIEDMRIWQGEEIKLDFDKLKESFQIMPYGDLQRYIFYLFPDLACDLTERWLYENKFIYIGEKKNIVITRTSRYHNHLLNYFFLKKHQEQLLFVGLRKEYEEFCNEWNLNISYHECIDAHELAVLIQSARFFISNQTMAFQIAEGLKVPRILERCPAIPNVIPKGKHAYDCHYQLDLEYYFDKLYKLTQ